MDLRLWVVAGRDQEMDWSDDLLCRLHQVWRARVTPDLAEVRDQVPAQAPEQTEPQWQTKRAGATLAYLLPPGRLPYYTSPLAVLVE